MTKFLTISFLALTVFSTMGQTSDTSFISFWTTFQKDIITRDYKALSTKTKFPLKAKGLLDYDTVDEYSSKAFQKIFSSFLSARIHTNGSLRYDKLKSYKLKAGANTNKSIRIDDMVFEKISGKWWLTLIYDGHSKY